MCLLVKICGSLIIIIIILLLLVLLKILKDGTNGEYNCRNLNLELATKAKACKGASQEGSPGVTSHAPESVGERERMNPHTFK
jgi:hypothetical protein